MKKLIAIVFFIAICSPAFCQLKTFECLQSFDKIWQMKDTIAAMLPKSYNYLGLDSGDIYRPRKSFVFTWQDSANQKITFGIGRIMQGGNVDFNIPAEAVITGARLSGPYVDIFPIWRSVWNKDADLVEVQKKGQDILGKVDIDSEKYLWVMFKPGGNGWIIEVSAR